jgi:flagellar hook-associated protein 3 FlgL
MQISTSLFYDRSLTAMTSLSAQADTLNTQISTGQKVSAASDDVVAWQQLQGIARTTADDSAYSSNISTAQGLLTQSDSTLSSVATQIQQAQELALQASNGTLSDNDRATIVTQLRSISDELAGLANTKDSRGQPLFGAATGDSAVTVASDGSVSFTGTGTPAAIPIGDGQTIQPTDSAQQVFSVSTSSGTTDVFAIIKNLADALETGGDTSGATATAISGLSAATDQISAARGSVGARGARLDLESSRLQTTATDLETTRSGLQDTDVTAAITNLQKTMTILQATQASFTKLSSLSLFDYLK